MTSAIVKKVRSTITTMNLKFSAGDQKRGMTLDELERVVIQARSMERRGSAVVKAETRISGRVRTIEIVEEDGLEEG